MFSDLFNYHSRPYNLQGFAIPAAFFNWKQLLMRQGAA
jgi:hypothetical protein